MLLLATGVVWGLMYTVKQQKVLLNTLILFFTVIVIGYSSFTMIVVRSLAEPPMNENQPDNVFALLSYLNREQYGDRPLVHGQYFNAKIVDQETQYTDPEYSEIMAYEVNHIRCNHRHTPQKELCPVALLIHTLIFGNQRHFYRQYGLVFYLAISGKGLNYPCL